MVPLPLVLHFNVLLMQLSLLLTLELLDPRKVSLVCFVRAVQLSTLVVQLLGSNLKWAMVEVENWEVNAQST